MYDLERMDVVPMEALDMAATDGGGIVDWISGKYKEYTQYPPMVEGQNI